MRKIMIACAAITICAGLPAAAAAEEVIVDGPSYDQGYRHHRHHHPYVALSDRGIAIGSVRERDRYHRYNDRGRCMTRTVTHTDENGDEVTRTMRRCD
ncbi:hypothetical protein C7U61_04590 [Rhizobium sp. JAB6]|uniref:hypothetical protein n=1 Tax=Rhizobium sp. JAB6 TaxID=2127050 RepID=UPI000D126150|nr:hypothetical protein [Rhizobium sp. JAB6]PST22602.1 hypothetical protein C7U61_04590 [Rhizobium sp. JAB6]